MNDILREDAIQVIDSNNGLKDIYNSKFLITGATGMIGMGFVNTLLTLNDLYGANIELHLVVRNKNKLPNYVLESPNVHIIEQDIVDPIKCDIKADYVIHAASPASPLIMKEHPVETNFANTIGTANALNYAKNLILKDLCLFHHEKYMVNLRKAKNISMKW